MANIQFLKGSQNNLDKIEKYIEGSFYLTEDSEKLYYAKTETNLINLSKQCIVVENSSDLPTWNGTDSPPWEGDIYYVRNGNMLVTYNSTVSPSQWTQINPPADPDTDTKISVDSISIEKDDTATDKIKFKLTLNHKGVDVKGKELAEAELPEAVTADFEITQDDFNAIVDGAEVGLTASNNTISTTGTGAEDSKKVTLVGAGSVKVATESNTITITGAEYSLDSSELANGARVALAKDGKEVGMVNLIAPENNDIELTFKQEENSEPFVEFKHKSYKDADGEDIVPTLDEKNKVGLNPSEKFEIISNITVDNGHITSIDKKEFTLPADKNYTVDEVTYWFGSDESDYTNTGKSELLNIRVSDTSGKSAENAIPLYYTVGKTKTVIPMNSSLSEHFYDKNEIDNKILGLNGVTYRGVLNNTGYYLIISGTDKVSHGDMYLTNEIISYKGENGTEIFGAKKGDILIFRSVDGEEKDGYIEEDKIIVDVIPSGDETDTTYEFSMEEEKIDEDSNDTVPAFAVTSSTKGKETVFFIPDGNLINTKVTSDQLIIDHAVPNSYKSAATLDKKVTIDGGKRTFTAIESVVRDSYGHIIDFTSSIYTLPKDNNTLYSFGIDAPSKTVTLKGDNGSEPGSFEIDGENKISVSLTTTDNANGIFTVSHDTTTVTNNENNLPEGANIPKLNLDSTFIDVEKIGYDQYGHIDKIDYKKYSLKDLQHNLDFEINNEIVDKKASTKKVIAELSLKGNNGGQIGESITLNLQSETLQLEAEEDNTLKVNLVWGTF